MKAVVLHQFGDPEALRAEEVADPHVPQGHVLVRMEAAAVNPSDLKNIQGHMKQTTLPRIPGRDLTGTVVSGPPHIVGRQIWATGGDLGFTRDGTHAQLVSLPEAAAVQRPANLTPHEAAAAPLGFVTAVLALVKTAHLHSNEQVLITGAAGSVGTAATQIARSLGARVLALVRTDKDAARAQENGAHKVIVAEGPAAVEQVRAQTEGRGADVVFDTVGGVMFETALACLAVGGRLVEISATGQRRVSFDLLDFYHKRQSIHGVDTLALDAVACGRLLAEMYRGFAIGELRAPAPAGVYPLDRAAEAYQYVAAGAAGKVLLIP